MGKDREGTVKFTSMDYSKENVAGDTVAFLDQTMPDLSLQFVATLANTFSL